ncbi:MAG: tRNA (adenosine(37)-N6)-threonylcarbamoyltransferase complex ATPase subunit type 1 TsaE [Acidobacteriota bacterium]
MTESVHRSRSPEETIELARWLARRYPAGAYYYLEGELGAGKTVFAKGIALAYEVDPGRVVSPTFALVNRYGGGSRTIYHVDLYRIENERELAELGLEEIEEEEAVLVVEWPEKLGRYRHPDAVVVRFEIPVEEEEARSIRIVEPAGSRATQNTRKGVSLDST